MIHLKAINTQNILDACELKTNQDRTGTTMEETFLLQRNFHSKTKYNSEMHPHTIYNNNVLIGFFCKTNDYNQLCSAHHTQPFSVVAFGFFLP